MKSKPKLDKKIEKEFDKLFPAIKVKTYKKDSVVLCSVCDMELPSWCQLEQIKQFLAEKLVNQESKLYQEWRVKHKTILKKTLEANSLNKKIFEDGQKSATKSKTH